jgi:hypothetical protein
MKTRFMKVYRLFRYQKYGEPIGPVIQRKKPRILDKSTKLNIVNEEEESDHENHLQDSPDKKYSLTEFPQSLCDNLFEDIVYEFILLHADSLIRA